MRRILLMHCVAALAALAMGGSAARGETVKVRISDGVLVGNEDTTVMTFKGTPYAEAPVGVLRWRPPVPLAAGSQERLATAYGPACPQRQHKDGTPNEGGYVGPTSEDCLSLNIFAPRGAKQAPVMVWLYGGGNTMGANSISAYDGSAFARDGVILVSVNYRLGALGFFAHPRLTEAAPKGEPLANYGLMDQVAALKWVQRNIKAFGGDPNNVTLFGESAGGVDILALMAAPSARGLFAKAVVESGGGWSAPVALPTAEAAGVRLMGKLGVNRDASLADLRALPADQLVSLPDGDFGPVVDGRLLTENATQAFARGAAAPVPLIIGSNSFEASLLAAFHVSPKIYLAMQPQGALLAYQGEPSEQAKAYAVFNDAVMGGPARWIAERRGSTSPTWLYYFSFRRGVYKDIYPGAPHASEIPFVFDSWDKIDPRLSKGGETRDDRALTKVVHACWVAFAKTAVPACPTPSPWPAYQPSTDQLVVFGDKVEVVSHFRKAELDAEEAAKAALLAPSPAP
jgi:para-nitrobenzyl esterase